MLIIIQVYCLFFGAIAVTMLIPNIADLIRNPNWNSFLNLQFTILSILICGVTVGLIEIHQVGIL